MPGGRLGRGPPLILTPGGRLGLGPPLTVIPGGRRGAESCELRPTEMPSLESLSMSSLLSGSSERDTWMPRPANRSMPELRGLALGGLESGEGYSYASGLVKLQLYLGVRAIL